MRPKREGLCPTAPILARRYVDPRSTPTGVDIGDQIDKRSFNLQYRRVDFTYCTGSKFKDISQYTAQVRQLQQPPARTRMLVPAIVSLRPCASPFSPP